MIIENNGIKYKFWWDHEDRPFCYCHVVKLPITSPLDSLASGRAKCHPDDNYVKSTGRRLSFTRLIDFLCQTQEQADIFMLEYFRLMPQDRD